MAVDDYITEQLVHPDSALSAALETSAEAGLPPISVSPSQGKLLFLLAKALGARNILEIGTLGGYSAIWLARALEPSGSLVTLEVNPKYAAIASANIARAGLTDLVTVRLGNALETLPRIVAEIQHPFDFIFIDADKEQIPRYFSFALELTRVGSVIVVDNVVRDGAIIDGDSKDARVQGVRLLNEILSSETHVSATTIQTVGAKGYDGFTIALVTEAHFNVRSLTSGPTVRDR